MLWWVLTYQTHVLHGFGLWRPLFDSPELGSFHSFVQSVDYYLSSNGNQNLTHMLFKVFHSWQRQHLGRKLAPKTIRTDRLEWSVIKTWNLPSSSLEARSYAQYSVTLGSAHQQKPTSFLKSLFTLGTCAKLNAATNSLAFFFPHFDYLHIKKHLLDIQEVFYSTICTLIGT
jgi:hypothetical protein